MSRRKALSLLLASAVALLLTGAVLAQSGGGYDLTWWTVDGGGVSVSGGDYRVAGTAGQFDAAPPLSGGDYTLYGGFWSGGGPGSDGHSIYLPLVLRG